ncbi:MAG: sugar transferase [Pseudomonadota bacterium]
MKRLFDIVLSGLGLIATAPVFVLLCAAILIRDGRPIFYVSERMKTPTEPFALIKFRTMSNADASQNTGVTGGDKANRITPMGRFLRRTRLDELPQLINVLKGDMSLVGPRPPLRRYTDLAPDLYAQVLTCKPGITGLATLHFHAHEERLIAQATTPSETEAIYVRRCVPRKARLDLIYKDHANVCYDAAILWQTLRKVIRSV